MPFVFQDVPTSSGGRFVFEDELDPQKKRRRDVPEMTAGSLARDIAAGVLQIGPTAVKGAADIARLATGDRVGTDTSEAMARGMESIREVVGSERAAAQRENFNADMADDEVGLGEALMRNKGALADQILPTVGSMFLPVGVAGAVGKLATAGKAAQAMDRAALVARVAAAQKVAGIGTVAAQNAADTFAELLEKGVPMEDAYLGAGITVPFSVVAGVLTGGGAEGAITRALTSGAAAKAGLKQFGKATLQEGAQEMGEEAGQITGEAVTTGETPSATSVGKQLAVAGTLGAVMGGGVDVANQMGQFRKPEEPGTNTPQPAATAPAPAAASPAATPATDPTARLAELEILSEQRDLTPAERQEYADLFTQLSDEQDAPQGTPPAGVAPAEAAPVEAPAAEGGDGAAVDGVPEEPAATDVEAAGVSGEFADLFDEQGRPKFSGAQSVKDFKKRTGLGQDGVRAIQAAVQEGRAITVDEARQADLAAQERRNAALEQSKAESEAENQRAKENSARPAQERKLLGEYEIPGLEGTTSRVRVFQQGDRVEAVGLDEGVANSDLSQLILSGQTVEQALATLYGDHGPNEAPNPSRVKRAGQPPTDFWSFAKSKGYTPAQIKIGTPEHAALKAEYDALKAGKAEPILPPLQPQPSVDLQNRDRSRAASVVQMSDIARNPDYMRLGPSRTPDSGAPMVFAVGDQLDAIAPENFGRQDVAVMSDGQRVPFRYAVVDATKVNPSNFADGRLNPEFSSTTPGTIKALNNGRTAGVRAAHEMGTAGEYVAGLQADEAMHGIPADVIARTPNPMLVRVYSDADNTANMAAKSQGQGLGMSPAELARQDAPLMDSSVLGVYEPGEITSAANRDFVRAFIGKLQAAGQDVAGMMTGDGQLSQDGRKRIQAALMQAAYGDSDIVEEMFDSTDTDIKAIGEALKTLAGQWANMRDSVKLGVINPQTDITGNLIQAIGLIRRARRDGMMLYDLVNQPDLMTGETPDATTVGVLRMFYSGQYMTRAVGKDKLTKSLSDYVTAAMATSADPGMFGDVVTAGEILATINPITEGQSDAEAQPEEGRGQPAGSGDPGVGAGEARTAVGRQRAGESGAGVAADRGSEPGQDAAPEAQQQVGQGDPRAEEGDGAAAARAGAGQQEGADGRATAAEGRAGAADGQAVKAKKPKKAAKPKSEPDALPADQVQQLERDFRTFPTQILNNLLERGEASKLYKAAGTNGASEFGDLSMDDKAAAYVKFVQQGGKPVENLPKDYNAWVKSEERAAEVRRLQSDRVVRQENGKPFKSKTSAQQYQERYDLTGTHEVVAVDGGFELRQLSPAAQAELKRKAEGRESYTEAQAAVAEEMGIGQTPDGEWDATDEQFDELERRTQARMRGETVEPILTAPTRAEAFAPATEADPFNGLKLPDQVKEYLLKPSVTLKDGKTVSPKEFVDGLLAEGYGDPEYFAAAKGSQVGFISKPGSPRVTLNDKQMFYADAAFMAKKKAGKDAAAPAAESILTAPAREDVLAQQQRAETAEQRDAREQIRRESEAGAGMFSLETQDGRQDTTGDLFRQTAAEPAAEPAEPKPEQPKQEQAKPAPVTYEQHIQRLEDRARRFGRESVRDEARSALASMALAREFGESMEDYLKRNPQAEIKHKAYMDWLDGKAKLPEQVPASDAGRADPFAGNKLFTSDKVAALRDQAGVSLSIDDGNAIADTATYGPASPEHQRLADTLAGRLSRAYGRAIVLDAVAPGSGAVGGRGRELAAVSTVARRLFGHEVVFVRHRGEPLFNGAMSTAIPDVLFINADATKPMMAVLGHELLHHLKRTHEGIYNTLNDRLNRLKKNERDYLHRLEVLYGRQGAKATANWDEELNADIVGDFFMDPEFWAAMAKDQPGLFRRVANAIIKFLDDVAAKIADIRPFGTDQYLTDIAAARAAVVDAMRQFSGAQVGAMTSQSEGINLSVAGLPDTIEVDGVMRPTTNSNGGTFDPSNPNIMNQQARERGLTRELLEQGKAFVREIEKLAEEHGAVYIRWSPTSERDLSAGSNSRDFVSGEIHSGLSAVEVTDKTHPVDIAKALSEYMFLRIQDSRSIPRIYLADRIGTDSDSHALIRPKKLLLEAPESIIRAIDSNFAEAYEYEDNIQDGEKRLARITDAVGRSIIERRIQNSKDALRKLLNEQPQRQDSADTLNQQVRGAFDGPEVGNTPIGDATEIEVDDKQRPTRNSNGQPIHPTEEGIRNFWRWFGSSRVVDEQGRPLVVYHGTLGDFSTFDVGKSRAGVAAWLTTDHEHADVHTRELQTDRQERERGRRYRSGGNIVPVFATIKNPLTVAEGAFRNQSEADIVARAKAEGHDGLRIERDGNVVFVAFDPTQIKSAIGNSGDFDPENPDIRFSRSTLGSTPPTPPQNPNAWQKLKAKVLELTSPDAIESLIYEYQDKNIDLKRLRDHIKELGGTITDLNDAYLGEELYHKRLAKRTQDFLSEELKPLLADMRARGVDMPTLERYLHARHAPEANRVLAERNPNAQMIEAGKAKARAEVKALEVQLQRARAQGTATKAIEQALEQALAERDRWTGAQAFKGTEAERLSLSGMSDAEAAAFMGGLPAGQKVHLEALAARVDAMQAKTLEVLEKYGLMDKATLDAWRSTYQFYVPLHRDEAHPDAVSHPIGQGFSTKGDASKRRTGSNEKVTNILAHIAMQREAALTRGEKNRVAKKLYLMAAQNPDPEIWSVDKPPMMKTVDRETGFVRTTVDPTYRNKPNVVMVRIGGKDHAITFNERNPKAVRMAQSIKGADVGDLNAFESIMGKATRWLASVNTQYNPIFGIINFARDVQAAILQLSTTPLKGQERAVAAYVPAALKGIYAEVRSRRKGQARGTGQWAKLWEDMQNEGGTTGYRELFITPDERVKALTKELNALDRGKASEAAHAVVDWLSDYNETMENAVRLAAYKVALDQGMSKERAASLAKNLTVNFNRRGRQTARLGAYYAFLNAAIQGTTRMVETLRGPLGRKIMLGGVMLGAVNALIGMAMMGGDDDEDDNWEKIPDFVKERSLIVPLGREDYLAIPMPLGYHVFPNLGRKAVEMMMHDDPTKGVGSHIAEMLRITLDAFNPLGGSENLAQMVTPTPFDPAVALMMNRDWTGKPIYREDMSGLDPTPGHTRTKDTASTPSKVVSEALNKITGGTDYQPGAISWTPDQIDYVIGQLTGGLGRELMKVEQTLTAPLTGEELPPHKIPLAGRLYGNTRGPSGESEKFYENVRRLNGVEREIRGLARDGGDVAAYRSQEPLVRLAGSEDGVLLQIRALRDRRSRIKQEAAPGYQDEVREIDRRIGEIMRDFNQEVRRAKQEARQ